MLEHRLVIFFLSLLFVLPIFFFFVFVERFRIWGGPNLALDSYLDLARAWELIQRRLRRALWREICSIFRSEIAFEGEYCRGFEAIEFFLGRF